MHLVEREDEGEWKVRQQDQKLGANCMWGRGGEVVAQTLTSNRIDDASQVPPC